MSTSGSITYLLGWLFLWFVVGPVLWFLLPYAVGAFVIWTIWTLSEDW